MKYSLTPSSYLLLRIGLAFVFLYAVGASFADPASWAAYFPAFLTEIFPMDFLVYGTAAFEVIISLWILSGWRIFIPSALAAAFLFTVVVLNPSHLNVTFRNISIICTATALALSSLSRGNNHDKNTEVPL